MISVKSSRYIYFDTRDCEIINGDYCSDVYINLNETISVNHDVDILFELVDFILPHSLYNIDNSNNTLNICYTYVNGSVTQPNNVNYTIPNGFYTIDNLVLALNNLNDDVVWSYSVSTQKLTITFPFFTEYFIIYNTSTIITQEVDVLGFGNLNIGVGLPVMDYIDADYRYELEDVVNLLKTQVLYIRAIDLMTTNITTHEKQRGNIIASMPFNVEFGETFYYSPYNQHPSKLESKMIKQIRLQILDSDFNLVNLYGADWNASFYLSFVYNRGRDLNT